MAVPDVINMLLLTGYVPLSFKIAVVKPSQLLIQAFKLIIDQYLIFLLLLGITEKVVFFLV